MRDSLTRSTIQILIASTLFVGCSTDVDRSGEGVDVVLPVALGGGSGATRFAPHTEPTRRHSYGVPLPIPPPPTSTHGLPPIVPAAPASVDLTADAPPVGNQGDTGSCQSWATGYTAMGWWATHVGLPNATFAPMYLYAQFVQGNCSNGGYVEQPLAIMQQQGVETTSDYEPMQDALDCTTQPTALQKANAASFKISGYTQSDLSQGPRAAIVAALASGRPAILSIIVYSEFENASSSDYLVGPPQAGDTAYGGHAITALGYDQYGVWIENQWGSGWGINGWAELSWDFIDGSFDGAANVGDVDTIDGVALSCSDSNSDCAAWAQSSQCQENPDYMLTSCCASCANADIAYETYSFSPVANPTSCMDVWQNGTANLTKIDEYTCNGTDAQAFTVLDAGHGVVHLYHPGTSKCVDDYHSSDANGTQIETYACNDTAAQDFVAQWYTDGSVSFEKSGTTSCIDVDHQNPADGTKVQLWGCNETGAQRWYPTAR